MRERQHDHGGAEADPAGLPDERDEHGQPGGQVTVVDAALLGRPHVREPQALGGLYEGDAVVEVSGIGATRRAVRGNPC
jgi:hypothetical protein